MRQQWAVAAPFCAATPRCNRVGRYVIQAALALVCLNAALNTPRLQAETPSYERAQQLRAQLQAKPAPRRTRTDYNLVIDAYKVIYHGMPMSPHAIDSILATADVLEDEGRVFRDPKLFLATINEYEYLRQHYPSSPHRVPALLAEAHVEQHDLRDPKTAEQKYRELIAHFPNTPEAAEARTALADLSPTPPANAPAADEHAADTHTAEAHTPDTHSKPSAAQAVPPRATSRYGSAHITATPTSNADKAPSADLLGASVNAARRGGPPVKLTGIRQLVTDDGVQLVFDLSSAVTFKTGRATNPTRLYFDIENTHVDRSLTLHPMVVSADPAQQWLVHRIRAAQFTGTMTRVVLEVDDSADAYAQLVPDPWRLMIDLHSVSPPGGPTSQQQATTPLDPPVTSPDAGTPAANSQYPASQYPPYPSVGQSPATSINLPPTLADAKSNLGDRPATSASTTPNMNAASNMNAPNMSNATLTTHSPAPATGISNATPAEPTSAGNSTLVRALGLKIGRVVIDAGHGGHDVGTIGPDGLYEKDVVLDIALRLGAELQQRLGVQGVYTRTNDTFIPLEQRTAMANAAQADLFISIHGNSSPESNVRGVETYYLSLTNQQDALAVASRENATSGADIHDLSDIVKRITQNDKMDESREFALDVQQQLYDGLVSGNSGLKDRGIKKAPFVVLIGANMPSILTEISFVTNSKDAKELRDPKYRERIADSLFKGVSEYMASLSGVHTAANQPHKKK
jgi:N-acetylmuramoyl-L-alanine amidase